MADKDKIPQVVNENLDLLHKQLVQDKYAVPADYNEFESTFLEPENSKALFNQLITDKYAIPQDYNSFVDTFGLKKKDKFAFIWPTSETSSETSSQPPATIPKDEATTPTEITTPLEAPKNKSLFKKTQLSVQEESDFQKWMGKKSDTDDYDYRGFYQAEKENGTLKPTINDYAKEDPNYHFYSIGVDGRVLKSPEHSTFEKTVKGEEEVGNELYTDTEGILRTRKKNSVYDNGYVALLTASLKGEHPTGEPVTAENYITAAPQAFNKRFGEAIRNVGELINLPQTSLEYYINKIGGENVKASTRYLEQAFKDVPIIGMFSKENMNRLADAIEKAGNPKAIPEDIGGNVLSTLGSVAFDIATIRSMPTSKLNALAKYGMERVPMFPAYLGIMQGTTAAREGATPKKTGLATAEGVAAGLTYEGMGITAGRFGEMVQKLAGGRAGKVFIENAVKEVVTGKQAIKTTASALANSALFEGDTRIKGGEKWTGAITGFVFSTPEFAGDVKEAVKQSVAKRAYVSYLTTTDNAIRTISKMNLDPVELRKKSDELWDEYESIGTKKNAIGKLLKENAVDEEGIFPNRVEEIAKEQNDTELLDAINNHKRLSEKAFGDEENSRGLIEDMYKVLRYGSKANKSFNPIEDIVYKRIKDYEQSLTETNTPKPESGKTETRGLRTKSEILEEKTVVDNLINVNATTQAIIENPTAFINEIKKDQRLSPAEKEKWIDKITNTVQYADPRIDEAVPYRKRWFELEQSLKDAETLYPDETIRKEKIAGIEEQIKEQQQLMSKTLSRPLGVIPKYEMEGKLIEKDEAIDLIKNATTIEELNGLRIQNDPAVEKAVEDKFIELTKPEVKVEKPEETVEKTEKPKEVVKTEIKPTYEEINAETKSIEDEFKRIKNDPTMTREEKDIAYTALDARTKELQRRIKLPEPQAKEVVDMTDAELTSESDAISKVIKQREQNIINSNTPLTGSNSGIGTLTEPELNRYTAINDELQSRQSISSEEAKKLVAEKRAKRREEQPKAETPIETSKQNVQKEVDKDGLLDMIGKYNALTPYQQKKGENAKLLNNIKINAQRLGLDLKSNANGFKLMQGTKAVSRTPTKVNKEKVEGQKLLADYDPEFQQYVNDVMEISPGLFGVMIGGLSNESRAQAYRDIKAGKKTVASAIALSELERMHKTHGGIDVWNDVGKVMITISPKEIQQAKQDLITEKRAELDKYSYLDADILLEKGLITKTEYDEITNYIRETAEQHRTAEEDYYVDTYGDNKGIEEEVTGKGEEVKPPPNEEPINPADITSGKAEENIVPGGTEGGQERVTPAGEEKPLTTDPVKQKQIDDINKEYNGKIADAQKELDGMTEEKRRKVIAKAEAEVNRRNTIFGDAEAKESDLIKPEDQGFVVSNKPVEAATRAFDERKVELTKTVDALTKERDSKIGEVLKQQSLEFGEEKPPAEPKEAGVAKQEPPVKEVSKSDIDFADKVYKGRYYGKTPKNALADLLGAIDVFKRMGDDLSKEKIKELNRIADSYKEQLGIEPRVKEPLTTEKLDDTVSKYGWKAEKNADGDTRLLNKKGDPVVIVKEKKGGVYQFLDMAGNKLMDGRGQIEKSVEKLLKDYYYAKEIPVSKETLPTEKKTIDDIKNTIQGRLIAGVGGKIAELQSRGAKADNYQRQLEAYEKNPSEKGKQKILQLEKELGYAELGNSYFDMNKEVPAGERKISVTKDGIKYGDKTYTDIVDVLDDIESGKLGKEEGQLLREEVNKFESDLQAKAEKKAGNLKDRIDKGADDIEDQIKKDIDDENGKLHLKLFPDLWSAFGTAQWKVFRPMRDALANVIARQLKKGVTTQTDTIRWSTKVLTNLYNGLLRTQADMHGSGMPNQIGKLEMSGAREYGKYKAKKLLDEWRSIVNGDWDSLNRVWSVLDPKLATKPTENPLTYGNLGLAEKNLYFALKEWMTWGHEITYANGLIPTKTYLKYKDVTGSSNYIARMYDKFEMDRMADPAIKQFATRGNDSYTSKIASEIYKMRKELNGIVEINGHEYDSMESLKEALDNGEITKDQYAENKDAIKSDEWRREHAIKDPTYLVAKRIMQTIQNVAVKQYMDAVIANHPEYVLTIPKREGVPGGFVRLGSSYSWGPFRNKVVASHIVEDMTGFFYQNELINTVYDAMKIIDRNKITQFYKKFRTVFNPFVQVGNVTGNVFFASINGINPALFVKRMYDNRNIAKKNPALYEKLLKAGYLGPVAITGEMNPIDPLNPKKGVYGKFDKWATNVYTGADNLAKIAAYQIYRRQGLTHEQAIRRGYDAFQNYATVGKTWDIASKTPLVGPTFVKFQADLQRILLNGMLTTPLTTIGTFMIIKMLGNLSSALSGETEEEQKVREGRKGAPSIPFLDIPLSFKVGKSEVNAARYLTPLYLYNKGDSEMELEDMSKFMPYQIKKREESNIVPKFVFADAAWGFIGSVWSDSDFRNVSIQDPKKTMFTDPNTPTDVKIWNIIRYVGRSQIPFWKGATDVYNAATGQLDYYERKRTWTQAILNSVIKIQQWDDPERKAYVEHNLEYLTSKYASLASKMGDAQTIFYKSLEDAKEKGLEGDAFNKVYNAAYKLREKSINKSLEEQIPVFKEIEEKTNVYKKWYPQDEFLDDNYKNIEAGKVQRFNVLDAIDFQKKYPNEYLLLKKNDIVNKPEIPKFYEGIALTEAEKKTFSNLYWSEYLRELDINLGLTQEDIDAAKKRLARAETADTATGDKDIMELSDIVSEAATKARDYARDNFRKIRK